MGGEVSHRPSGSAVGGLTGTWVWGQRRADLVDQIGQFVTHLSDVAAVGREGEQARAAGNGHGEHVPAAHLGQVADDGIRLKRAGGSPEQAHQAGGDGRQPVGVVNGQVVVSGDQQSVGGHGDHVGDVRDTFYKVVKQEIQVKVSRHSVALDLFESVEAGRLAARPRAYAA